MGSLNKKLIVIAAHMPDENGGSLHHAIQERGFEATFVNLHEGERIPAPTEYDALIVMGGLISSNSPDDTTQHELQAIGDALEAEKPYLGICLGMQSMIKAAGGEVVQGARKEIGFRDSQDEHYVIKLTGEGKNDPIFKGIAADALSPALQFHEATVALNEKMIHPTTLLATDMNNIVPHQVVKVGKNAYGIQSHWEATPDLLALWLKTYSSLWEYDSEKIMEDFKRHEESYSQTSKRIFNNFLDIVEVHADLV